MDREKTKIINNLRTFLEKAKKVTNIKKTILFGSQATGKSKENSDVDIIIISEDFKDKVSYKRSPEFYLMWDYPQDIDIICLTPEEFEKKKKQIGVIKQAVEDGIEI
ncbi:nucleotidyltransferase domain-containing protein [Candidatus Pacearchaeota archaeon]|nr:nucleotidyltransferase domain-containing protein [Candidatus Pacearchaeota archaeon]